MKKCFYASVITAVGLWSCSYAQHTLVLKNDKHTVAISPYAYVLKHDAALTSVDKVIHADSAQFVRNPLTREIDYGVGKTNAWCMFYVRNESDEENWILKIQHSRVDTAQLFVVRDGKTLQRFPMTGHFQKLSERSVRALPFAFVVPIKKNETIACYLYTERQYGRHAAILNLQTTSYFESYEYAFNIILGVVCGMVILAAMVGAFLFLFVRQRLYVLYSVYALSFLFVLLADTGLAQAGIFFPLDQTVVNGFTMIFYYWMGACLGVFTIELLQLRQYARPWLYWFGIVLSYTCGVNAVLLFIPGLPEIIRWVLISSSYYLATILNLYILYILSISVVKKEPIVYFYMAGFFFTSLIALLLTLSDFHILDFPFENKDVLFLTPLVEILCVALGIGIHFSKTLKERINVQLALTETRDQIITIQEDERRRIAQDLHDDVGNSLAAIRNMVAHHREPLAIEKEIDNIIGSVRAISHDLMPVDFNEFSLIDIISHNVEKFKDHPSIALEFDYTGKAIKLRPLTELVIYRIINELITNIFKHSRATKAFIQLIYQERSLVVTVEDNGMGMKQPALKDGIGLRSIRSRAEYMQATLKIESDDKGTLIILEVPYGNIA
ncbi:MAG TPA: 7TM diverse intracellular signaling domain-containing protein [Cyclobacteriaceae bacterium]|nr:7TM diverse intracellular signaling domain-containing protein [Cyclobacteriaceae bacterium]